MSSPLTLAAIVAVVFVVADLFLIWRKTALGHLDRAWSSLMIETGGGAILDESQLAGLPEPVQRFVRQASGQRETDEGQTIGAAGNWKRLELRMEGNLRSEPVDDPVALRMHELLVPGRGFVWRAEGNVTGLRLDGGDMYYDGKAALRFFLGWLMPMVQESGGELVGSARGRLFAESILLPATLIRERGVVWTEAPDEAGGGDGGGPAYRVEGNIDGETLEMIVRFGADGFPWAVDLPRWRFKVKGAAAGVAPFRARLGGWRFYGEVMLPERIAAQWLDLTRDGGSIDAVPAEERDPTRADNDPFFTFLDARVTSATAA